MAKDVLIISGARTPMGEYGGALRDLSAIELGAVAVGLDAHVAGAEDRRVADAGDVGDVSGDFDAAEPLFRVIQPLSAVCFPVVLLCSAASIMVRFRRARGLEVAIVDRDDRIRHEPHVAIGVVAAAELNGAVDQAASDLGGLLILGAVRHPFTGLGSAPVAFAVLDRARAAGDCLPQLTLAFLLSTFCALNVSFAQRIADGLGMELPAASPAAVPIADNSSPFPTINLKMSEGFAPSAMRMPIS